MVTGGGSGSSNFPALILIIVAVLMGLLVLVTLVICIIIFCMCRGSARMDNTLNSMNYTETSTDSPSLAKKMDAGTEGLDAKASNGSNANDNMEVGVPPVMSRVQDLTREELEGTEHWHELLPREGRSSRHSLKRNNSRDSRVSFDIGSVRRALSRSHNKPLETRSLNRKDSRNRLFSLEVFSENHEGDEVVQGSLKRSQSQDGALEARSKC